jgi:hypothetical protein
MFEMRHELSSACPHILPLLPLKFHVRLSVDAVLDNQVQRRWLGEQIFGTGQFSSQPTALTSAKRMPAAKLAIALRREPS